jgi:stress response protein YsnF
MQGDLTKLIGTKVVGADGDEVGTIDEVFKDDQSGRPSWIRIRTGLFGKKGRLVPLADSRQTERGLVVAFSKQHVKDAPDIDADHHLSAAEVDELNRHYRRRTTGTGPDQAPGEGRMAGRARGEEEWVTRSEERAQVGTESRESGRVRVRKHVETEPVEQQVRVSHEVADIERVPITEQDRAAGAPLAEDEQEVVLHEERPVLSKETVPVERVRVNVRKQEEDVTVRDQVRKERIEVETDDRHPGGSS